MNILPSLWAIGHIGSTVFGLLHLTKVQPNLLNLIANVAEQNIFHYSIKGSLSFIVLN